NVTGLVWMKCTYNADLTGCTGDPFPNYRKDWQGAKDYCEGLEFAGKDDWRLPGIYELITIVNYGKTGPAIDSTYFPNTMVTNWYWSEDVDSGDSARAWIVSFLSGIAYTQIKKETNNEPLGYVRCVRGDELDTQQFMDNGDGTVTDNGTGLMWLQEAQDGLIWSEALKYCEDLKFAGYTDWRLPDIKEMASIIDFSKVYPAADKNFFPDTLGVVYFSSTTNLQVAQNVFCAYFHTGEVKYYSKTLYKYYARCIRSAQ
ncbi:MAG: DUF1566 domain-containing protein, partial [Deltaproteobacteria bacterium]|nr:DUF1566 domain-containing protein [Deltaproteobacteria bacterium]